MVPKAGNRTLLSRLQNGRIATMLARQPGRDYSNGSRWRGCQTVKLVIAYVVIVVVVFGLAGWWQTYRYHDCKKVGHSTLYCLLSIGK